MKGCIHSGIYPIGADRWDELLNIFLVTYTVTVNSVCICRIADSLLAQEHMCAIGDCAPVDHLLTIGNGSPNIILQDI